MTLRESKEYFEYIFFNNWTQSPIHYAGEEFKNKGLKTWVNPMYHAGRGKLTLGGSVKNTGVLNVICWADTDAEALEVADDVIAMILSKVDTNLFSISKYEIPDEGWDDSNRNYVFVSFDMTHYAGTCFPTNIVKRIVHNAVPVTLNGVQVTN